MSLGRVAKGLNDTDHNLSKPKDEERTSDPENNRESSSNPSREVGLDLRHRGINGSRVDKRRATRRISEGDCGSESRTAKSEKLLHSLKPFRR